MQKRICEGNLICVTHFHSNFLKLLFRCEQFHNHQELQSLWLQLTIFVVIGLQHFLLNSKNEAATTCAALPET